MAGQFNIIGGRFKGLKLQLPPEGVTRPLRAMVKKSLFDSLGDDLQDAACLDLFAGSGSIGLEAVSRGAKSCVFVESSPEVFPILQKNVDKIRRYVDNDTVILKPVRIDAEKFLSDAPVQEAPFDFVFLDPPYVFRAGAEDCLELLAHKAGWVTHGGMAVYQFRGELKINHTYWRVIDSRVYGESVVVKLIRDVD